MKRYGLMLLSLLLFSVLVRADGNDPTTNLSSTAVYIVASQATTSCVHTAAAANGQAIVTIPACGAGSYFYITYVESTYSAIAAPAATLMATTSTNIPTSFGFSQPMQAAVGDNSRTVAFAVPLKTTLANTATVLTGNAAVAAISQNMKLCGFCAK